MSHNPVNPYRTPQSISRGRRFTTPGAAAMLASVAQIAYDNSGPISATAKRFLNAYNTQKSTPTKKPRKQFVSSKKEINKMPSGRSLSMVVTNLPGAYTGKFSGPSTKDSKMKSLALRKGCYLQWETGKTITHADSLTLVHALPNRSIVKAMMYAWLRSWSEKYTHKAWMTYTVDYNNIFYMRTPGLGEEQTFAIDVQYYIDNTSTTLSSQRLFLATTGEETADVIAGAMAGSILVLMRQYPNIQLLDISVYSTSEGYTVGKDSFQGLNVEYQVSYVLSIQSVAAADGTDKNPNEVVVYTGSGNGPRPKFLRTDQYSSYVASHSTGIAEQAPNSSNDMGCESYNANSFNNCQRKYTCLLNAGEIKKSVVAKTGSGKLSKVLRSLVGVGSIAHDNVQSTFGNYKMYHFEGMISKTFDSVKLDIEFNFKCSAIVKSTSRAVMAETSTVAPTF